MIAALLMTATAFAQRGGDRGQRRGGDQGGRMRGGNFQMMGQRGMRSEAELLNRSDVQKDIKLTADQKTKLEALREELGEAMRARFAGGRGGRDGGGSGGGTFDREAMREEMDAVRKEVNEKTKAILTDEQWTRLGQIRIQLASVRAVMDPEIEKKLGLKATQKIEINKLNEALNQANGQIRSNGRENGIDSAQINAEIAKNNEIMNAEIDKVLTKEQLAIWSEMKGKPFEADPNIQTRGGAGFGRGGDRTGGGGRGGGSTGGG